MQTKRQVLFIPNDNKTSRTPVQLLWPLHVALTVFNVPLRWFALKKVCCSKTKFMVLTRSHELQKITMNVVAGAVKEVNQIKYLGVLIDNQLKWQQQLDHVCKKTCMCFVRST